MSDQPHPLASLQDIVEENPDQATEHLPELVRYLRNGSPKERDAASQVLGEYAQKRPCGLSWHLKQLIGSLQSKNGRVRTNVSGVFSLVAEANPDDIVRLERSTKPSIIDELAQLTFIGPRKARMNAGEAIARVAVAAPEVAAKALHSQGFSKLFVCSAKTRRYAVVACSQVVEVAPEAVRPHVQHIRDGVQPSYPKNERLAALATLGELAKQSPALVTSDMETLLATVRDDDPEVRGNAIGVMAVLARSAPSSVTPVRGLAADLLLEGTVPERVNAGELLYRLAKVEPDSIRTREIGRRLETARKDDSNPRVRGLAENALAELSAVEQHPSVEIPEFFRQLAHAEDLGAVVGNAAGRVIVNIGRMVEDRHQVIEVSDGSRVEGDVGNAHQQRSRSSRTDRDSPASEDRSTDSVR